MLLTTTSTIDNVARFFTLLLIFAFVLAVTYFSTKFIANVQRGRTHTGNMEVIETVQIAQNRYLQIVKVGKKYLVIAVCKDSITFLAEVEEMDLDLQESPAVKNVDFSSILEKMKDKLPKK